MRFLPPSLLHVPLWACPLAGVPLCLLLAAPHSLQAGPTLPEAVAASPSLDPWRLRAQATAARQGASGQLPDPRVEVAVSRMGGAGGPFTSWELAVRQELPRRGERAADRDRAAAGTQMARAEWAMAASELAADTARDLAQRRAALARAELLRGLQSRLTQALSSADSALSTGAFSSAEHLALQSRAGELQLRIQAEEATAENAASSALTRLGWPPSTPLPDWASPDPASINTEETPALAVAAARQAEARSMEGMARASRRPMTAVGLRLERAEESMGAVHSVGLAFMSDLPWRARRLSESELTSAQLAGSAARAEAVNARRAAALALARLARAQRLWDASASYAAQTTTRLDAEAASLLAGASAGSTQNTALLLLEVLERGMDARMAALEAESMWREEASELWRYAPVPLDSAPPHQTAQPPSP